MVGALGVVIVKDIFRSALLLVVVFLAVAGLFAMMNAEFLAVVQVLIYAGAIAILIIFAIMLTREVQQGNMPNRLQPAAVVLPALLLAGFIYVAIDTDWNQRIADDEPVPRTAQLRDQYIEDQAFRRTTEVLQANTVGGLPADWEDVVDRDIQRQIDEELAAAGEDRLEGRPEAAARHEAFAASAADERIFLEQAKLISTLSVEFMPELEGVTQSGQPSERLLDALVVGVGENDIAEIVPKVQAGKWWLAGSDGDLKYSVVSTDNGLEIYEGRYEAAEERSGIGELLINDFVLPFEIASVLLLAAIIGALVLVRER